MLKRLLPGDGQRRRLSASLLGFMLLAVGTASPAQALTIRRNFVGGNPAPRAVGGGNIVDVFNAAADYWEAAIQDDYTLTLNYAWETLVDRSLATYSPQTRNVSAPFRNVEGFIRFDNDASYAWFVDPTPEESSEYLNFTTSTRDLGHGEMNIERRWSHPTGDAVGRFDLFNVALHEIGHGLNILSSNRNFRRETVFDNDIDLTGSLPFAGSMIPTTPSGGGHIDLPQTSLYTFISRGQRKMLTEADILASAQVSHFSQLNLNPELMSHPPMQAVPEGNFGWAVLFVGAGALELKRRRGQESSRPA